MDEISATGRGKDPFRTCQVSSEEPQTVPAFQVEALTTCLMQEVNEEADDHSNKGTERCETFRIGSERDLCRRLRRLLLHR